MLGEGAGALVGDCGKPFVLFQLSVVKCLK